MRTNLEARHPGLAIAGTGAPPFRPIEDRELDDAVARMRDARTDVVWIGLGAPKQDVMGARLRERDAAPLLCCVGAAFDFVAGTKRRAPAWMRRWGLEWAYRLGAEPGRLGSATWWATRSSPSSVLSDRLRGRG